ncbi:MAG TPA: molecular chaperone DnaJ [Acidimicrobiales bacterium]|nr:molecular chaperone DnaJ [Acidimicrobiales bacterium]
MAPQREWFEKDYYKVLGVPQSATDKDIAKAYRDLAKKYHPDANPGSEERFKEISAAFDVIGDPARRKEYDEVRSQVSMGNVFGGAGAPGGAGPGSFRVGMDDLGDLIGNIFSRSSRTGRTGPTATGGPQRGADLEAELTLSFLDAVNGLETTVNVTSEAPCHVCGGSGAAPGTTPVLCPTCAGAGVLTDNQGLFSFSRACPTCSGTGRKIEQPCPNCQGLGMEFRARQVKVRIPAGVEDGQRIRLKSRGVPGRNGGPAGDLYVVVHVGSHPVFGRRGRDLTVTVPITYPEATLGAAVSVPTLDGPVTLKVPAGSRSGRTLRVRGRGVRTARGTGDLLATLDIVVPRDPDPEQVAAIEKLAAVSDGDNLRAATFGTGAGTGSK